MKRSSAEPILGEPLNSIRSFAFPSSPQEGKSSVRKVIQA